MKVPRNGGSGQPRYFVLFSDMIMYCKIKSSGHSGQSLVGTLHRDSKTNALECGCMLPLKSTKGMHTHAQSGPLKVSYLALFFFVLVFDAPLHTGIATSEA